MPAAGFDLEAWIAALDVEGPEAWNGGKRWVFPTCPWDSTHTNKSAYVVQLSNGAHGFQSDGKSLRLVLMGTPQLLDRFRQFVPPVPTLGEQAGSHAVEGAPLSAVPLQQLFGEFCMRYRFRSLMCWRFYWLNLMCFCRGNFAYQVCSQRNP